LNEPDDALIRVEFGRFGVETEVIGGCEFFAGGAQGFGVADDLKIDFHTSLIVNPKPQIVKRLGRFFEGETICRKFVKLFLPKLFFNQYDNSTRGFKGKNFWR
jgi:hypothetical protein